MAYRGRVLVELETALDETPKTPVENLSTDDMLRVQVRVHFIINKLLLHYYYYYYNYYNNYYYSLCSALKHIRGGTRMRYTSLLTKARFPLPEFTARVHGP